MTCPKCKSVQVTVQDTRQVPETVRRRRWCLDCGFRFITVEVVEAEVKQYKKRKGKERNENESDA